MMMLLMTTLIMVIHNHHHHSHLHLIYIIIIIIIVTTSSSITDLHHPTTIIIILFIDISYTTQPSSSSNNEEDTNEQTYSEYASVCAGNSKATLHPDTTDFHSASARSLNSFNISFADQSSDRNGSLMTIPKDNESLLETCEIELSDMTTSQLQISKDTVIRTIHTI